MLSERERKLRRLESIRRNTAARLGHDFVVPLRPTGRVCVEDDCRTVLSVYNREERCAACLRTHPSPFTTKDINAMLGFGED